MEKVLVCREIILVHHKAFASNKKLIKDEDILSKYAPPIVCKRRLPEGRKDGECNRNHFFEVHH